MALGTRFRTLDPWLFVVPAVLISIGTVVIYVLTADGGLGLTIRQLAYAILSLVVLAVLPFIDYRNAKGWAVWAYGLGMLLLGLVPIIGKEEFGAKLWIDIGFIQFQPGEVMKFFALIAVAAALVAGLRSGRSLHMRSFWIAVAAFLLPVGIIFLQPDFGTAVVIALSCFTMVLHVPLSRLQKLIVALGAVVVVGTVVLAFQEVAPFNRVIKSYQRARLVSFLDPEHDTSGAGYNVAQAVIAVGSGGVTGTGLGFGTQSQLRFVPVAHADFIFAAITEAWGWVGSVTIIGLLTFLVYRCLHAASIAHDQFGRLVCIGVAAKILFELLINVGMNIRIMPVTGIPLPMISYGGTALLTNAICIALVQSVVLRYKRLA